MSKRFVTLDAMRGVAALAIVHRHAQHAFGGHDIRLAPLAVDFFFALSGFVLAHTYDPRFQRGLTALDFMRARALRLYPLFALGLLTGAIVSVVAGTPAPGFGNLFLLPKGPGALLFPGDDPAWSLFFEFWVANLIWAVFWRQLRGSVLGAILAIGGAAMLVIAVEKRTYDLGWQWNQLGFGMARVTFSFFLGVWLSRRRRELPFRFVLPPWAALLGLALLLSGLKCPAALSPFYLAGAVFAAIPALIYFSAELTEAKPAFLVALGNASYAVYATHWAPLVLLAYLTHHAQFHTAGSAAYVIAAGLGAVALDRFYDRPARRWLASFAPRPAQVSGGS